MLEETIAKLEAIEFRLNMSSYLAILADAQWQQGNLEDAKKTCDRALALISSGADRWFEPEVLRIDALVESRLNPGNAEKIEAKFCRSIDCAKKMGFPVFELRGLLTLQNSSGLNRHDIDIKSRIKELSHLQNLDRRVEAAIEARRVHLTQSSGNEESRVN